MLCDLYIYHPAEWYDQQPNSELFGGTMFVLLALESTEHRPGTERKVCDVGFTAVPRFSNGSVDEPFGFTNAVNFMDLWHH